ncbi:MAG: FHA domain-containing protein [Cyanobacteriota bacterium]
MKFCLNCGKFLNIENTVCSVCENINLNSINNEEIEKLNTKKGDYIIAKLVLKKGGTEGREFPIYSDIANIGRWDPYLDSHPEVDLSDEDIDAKVSRKHARIIKKDDGFYIEDFSSRNGTFLNREFRLVKDNHYQIKDQDEVIIGNIFFKFQIVK